MSNDYGPGMGTLVGMAMGAVSNANADRAEELAGVRAELRRRTKGALWQAAFASAAQELAAEIVDELRQEAAGNPNARRLSVPANTQLRNDEYVAKMERHLRRLSDGKEILTREEVRAIKADPRGALK